MKNQYLLKIFILITLCTPSICSAKQAQIMLYPTRLILDQNQHSASILLKNIGDGTGDYKIELIDIIMPEEGATRQALEEEKVEFSAKSFLRISPRSTTLEQSEDQNIRIMVRKPANIADGEYRAHLKATMTDNSETEGDESGKNVVVMAKPKISLIIPIIIRYGNPEYKVSITDTKLRYDLQESGAKVPYADITFLREGNRSSMGDIDITYISKSGSKHVLRHIIGIPIYRPTAKRKVSFKLEVPDGLKIDGGKLQVTYRSQAKEGSNIITEAEFAI